MSQPPSRFLSYAEIKSVGDRFLELLHRLGVDPLRASNFESELLSIRDLLDVWANPSLVANVTEKEKIQRAAAGIHDLAAKVLAAEACPEFEGLKPHLELIGRDNLTGAMSQNAAGVYNDDAGRKLAELYMACLAIHCGPGLALDHPVNSKGDNPDVMFNFDGQAWALAIKTISTRSGETIFERIEDALVQIDRCSTDAGLVVINARDAIRHDELLHPAAPFTTLTEANDALQSDVAALQTSLRAARSVTEFQALFAGRKGVCPILFMAQTFVILHPPGLTPLPTALKTFNAFDPTSGANIDPRAQELAASLNHWTQVILRGNPGPPPF